MSALWMKNTSGSDPHSYEVTKRVAKKAQKNFFRLQQETSTIPVQCSRRKSRASFVLLTCGIELKCLK